MLEGNRLAKLPTETLYLIMEQLNRNDLKNFSKTCRWFYQMSSKFRFGFVSPEWEVVKDFDFKSNFIASNYRDGVWSNNIFYLVIFSKEEPICWSLNLTNRPITWTRNPITIILESDDLYEPIRYSASAIVEEIIYIYGGENIETKKLSNVFYKLDIKTFNMSKIKESSTTPAPRKMHTLNTIDDDHLIMFGGKCLMEGEENMYDTQHFAIYDVKKNIWSYHRESINMPYRRASHSTTVLDERLYIYGGQQINSISKLTEIHDDKDIHLYNIRQDSWHRIITPSPDGSRLSPTLSLPSDWTATDGSKVGRRVDAAMFSMHHRIIILSGMEKDNFDYEQEGRPWELLKSLSLEERNWDHIRVKGLPQMGCVAVVSEYKTDKKGIFVIGKVHDDDKLIMGWIKDSIDI
ncbi:12599_t:CDS:1 [Gigaspora margarita]|uniref:12599_t:CDS:1 n=1 Tax=Gigaspora margarita TaxID=4874 RepID=A0ABN7VAQ9_GIGMA|nr:12599_t:CDS:1 [Gigaspora margarita]